MKHWQRWAIVGVALLLFIGSIPFIFAHTPLRQIILLRAGAKINATVEAERMELSWCGPQRFWNMTISSPDLDGKIEEVKGSVPFWKLSSMSQSMKIQGGTFSIHPKTAPSAQIEKLNASISGRMIQASGVTKEGNQTGEFSIKGKAAKNDVDLAISTTRMPTLFVDRFFHLKGLLEAALGPTFDCTATVTLQEVKGSVNLYLTAMSASITALASFDEDWITLQRPLVGTFHLTKELSEHLLKNVNPLFLTGVQSKTPAHLRISDKDFAFPRSLDLDKLQIGDGSIDLGQVRIDNGPSLASIMSLLKGANISNQKRMNAWFTPLSFSLHKGTLVAGRMDVLLADTVHLATWGKINLIKDKIDMTLGIPAETLAQAFGLKNLPSSYVMQIPIQGSTQNPDIVTGPAAAKIAATLAAQNIPKKGSAAGTLLNLFNPSLIDDSTSVPPAKRPFPWERR